MKMSPDLVAKLRELEQECGSEFEAEGVTEIVRDLAQYLMLHGKPPIPIAVIMITVAGKLFKDAVGGPEGVELLDIIVTRVREEMLK